MHVLIYRRISRRCANVIYGFTWMLGVISSGIRVAIDATLTLDVLPPYVLISKLVS